MNIKFHIALETKFEVVVAGAIAFEILNNNELSFLWYGRFNK